MTGSENKPKAMLKVKNVTKVFGDDLEPERQKKALDDFSITVNDGDFLTVIGSNGSGKSTLMNIIAGKVIPSAGTVMIDGEDVTRYSEVARSPLLGRVFQDPLMGTCADMMVQENLALAYRRTRRKGLRWAFKKDEDEFFKKELASLGLGLEDRYHEKIGSLSGGQRQAITLLMATIVPPKLLLLDEHTAALDPKTAKRVLEITEQIVATTHLTTIMITHNMRDALRYGNRLVMLHEGRLLFEASGEEKKRLTIDDLLAKFDADEEIGIPEAA